MDKIKNIEVCDIKGLFKKEILPLLEPNILEETIKVLPEYNSNFYNKLNDYGFRC